MANDVTVDLNIGARGESAYEIAVKNGYSGTEAEWIAEIEINLTDATNLKNDTQAIADGVQTNADLVQTNADLVQTNADLVQTNTDLVQTNADLVQSTFTDITEVLVVETETRHAVQSYGNGIDIDDSSKTININADTDNPFVASIADGFKEFIGQYDHLVSESTTKQLTFTEEDGDYFFCVDKDGTYTLETVDPNLSFDSSAGVMRGDGLLKIAQVTILDGVITDLDLMPVGDSYETEWFPVELDTLYELDNLFKDNSIKFDIWWNSTPSDESKRWVIGQVFVGSINSGSGAFKRIETDSIYIGTGRTNTWFSTYSSDPETSTTGYYKITVKRGW
jgi:hypothetical protein